MTVNITKEAVVVMLDAIMHHQRLLSANIANANKTNATTKYVDFNKVMEALSNSIDSGRGFSGLSDSISTSNYTIEKNIDGQIELDQEVAAMNSNVIRYKALVTALGKHGALMSTVIDSRN